MFFFMLTFGCKVNQYESQSLREAWLTKGWTEVDEAALADWILINSCAITAKTVADLRHQLRKTRRAAPQARILLTGCGAAVLKQERFFLPAQTFLIMQKHKDQLTHPEILVQNASRFMLSSLGRLEQDSSVTNPSEPKQAVYPCLQISGYKRSRAVLKIQDGCSQFCAYCIVPFTRGPAVSRQLDGTFQEFSRLAQAGFREINISGINLHQYGRDLTPPHDFWDFLKKLEERFAACWSGQIRLRLSSLEPGQLTEKALDHFTSSHFTTPHLHISLQSGSASVLRRMGRSHTHVERFVDFIKSFSKIKPLFGLGVDLIAGFPGESDQEFEETLRLCSSLPFSYGHVFPYSKRPGTRAAAMPGQIPEQVKKERARLLRTLFSQKQEQFLDTIVKKNTVTVIVENKSLAECKQVKPWLSGIDEFYNTCLIQTIPAEKTNCSLLHARPVGIYKNKLLVEAP